MKKVIISQRAYLSILAEVYERVETETGGVLLGHREGDIWYVLESIEPGPKSIFTPTYFEYDDEYVTYRANKVSRLYKCSVELLGLWHRHPSLMKTFSSTDDVTNKTYSDMLGGAISGIVTLGNGFEITMYYVPSNVRYEQIEWIVDDNLVPKDYLAYYDTDYYKNLINEETGNCYLFKRALDDKNGTVRSKEQGIRNAKYEHRKQSRISNRRRHNKKGFNYLFSKKIVPTDFENRECVYDEHGSVHEKQKDKEGSKINDIAIIFDTIEPEIAYLQQLESEGKIKCNFETKKERNGKKTLILTIVDMRQAENYCYKMVFFISNGYIRVKNENGEVNMYNKNFISMILGSGGCL